MHTVLYIFLGAAAFTTAFMVAFGIVAFVVGASRNRARVLEAQVEAYDVIASKQRDEIEVLERRLSIIQPPSNRVLSQEPSDDRFEWQRVDEIGGDTLWVRGPCKHVRVEPVTSIVTGDLLANLCLDCGAQLSIDGIAPLTLRPPTFDEARH